MGQSVTPTMTIKISKFIESILDFDYLGVLINQLDPSGMGCCRAVEQLLYVFMYLKKNTKEKKGQSHATCQAR